MTATIEAGKNTLSLEPAAYDQATSSVPGTPADYEKAFLSALRPHLTENAAPCVTISAGFDSNLLLHAVVRECPDQPVCAFSIGGFRGVNEVPVASRAVACYPNVRMHSAFVGSSALNALPDIVYRLEGSVYERGVFLQYELARLAKKCGVRSMLFGEGADQVLDISSNAPIASTLTKANLWLPPREMLGYVILKKNALLMSSFGIEGHYPYIEESFLRVARSMRGVNGVDKLYHKYAVRSLLPEDVAALLFKQGGSTSLSTLFDTERDFLSFERAAAALPFFCEKQAVLRHGDMRESCAEHCMKIVWLHLFDRIFLSGAYDKRFGDTALPEPLAMFLSPSDKPVKFPPPKRVLSKSLYRHGMRILCSVRFRLWNQRHGQEKYR